MEVSVKAPSENKRHGFQNSVVRHICDTLHRFSDRISRVDVTLTDANGPRRGIDKHCRVVLVMPGYSRLAAASSRHEHVWGAVGQAAERSRKIVVTRLKRTRTLRMRRPEKPQDLTGVE